MVPIFHTFPGRKFSNYFSSFLLPPRKYKSWSLWSDEGGTLRSEVSVGYCVTFRISSRGDKLGRGRATRLIADLASGDLWTKPREIPTNYSRFLPHCSQPTEKVRPLQILRSLPVWFTTLDHCTVTADMLMVLNTMTDSERNVVNQCAELKPPIQKNSLSRFSNNVLLGNHPRISRRLQVCTTVREFGVNLPRRRHVGRIFGAADPAQSSQAPT